MDGRENIEKYLLQMICTSKLPAELFDKDSSTIRRATEDFVADYLRWYPDDTRFDYYKLLVTPQLGAILCYRISHVINKLQKKGGGKYFWHNRLQTRPIFRGRLFPSRTRDWTN